MLSKDHPRFSHFKNQSFSENTWNNLIQKLKRKKLKYIVMYLVLKLLKSRKKIMLMDIKFIRLILIIYIY